jgi:hypothetical protein
MLLLVQIYRCIQQMRTFDMSWELTIGESAKKAVLLLNTPNLNKKESDHPCLLPFEGQLVSLQDDLVAHYRPTVLRECQIYMAAVHV